MQSDLKYFLLPGQRTHSKTCVAVMLLRVWPVRVALLVSVYCFKYNVLTAINYITQNDLHKALSHLQFESWHRIIRIWIGMRRLFGHLLCFAICWVF